MKKIKVLHFELDKNLGGIESFLFNLFKQIDKRNVQFDFVTAVAHPALEKEIIDLGGNVYHVSDHKKIISYILDISRLLNAEYDIVHIHKNSAANIIPFIVANKYKKSKIIVHSHNTAPTVGGVSVILHKINKNYLWKAADEHLACSLIAGEWLYSPNTDFKIVTNSIITKSYLFNVDSRKRLRNELKIPEDALVIGHVGRFVNQKNHERLISIFTELLKRNNNCYLIMVGDGALYSEIEERVVNNGIQDYVRMLKVRKDVPQIMSAMDVFLMPSLYEGLPIVGIEAQASGLEVFLSDTISPQTDVTNTVIWFNLDQEDTWIANLILKNSKKNSLSSIRTERNQLVKEAGFDIENTAEMMLEIYKNLAKRGL